MKFTETPYHILKDYYPYAQNVLIRPDDVYPSITYTITTNTSGSGTVSPSGNINAYDGFSKLFIITPDSDWLISDVSVDGVSKGVVGNIFLLKIKSNHIIDVVFNRMV